MTHRKHTADGLPGCRAAWATAGGRWALKTELQAQYRPLQSENKRAIDGVAGLGNPVASAQLGKRREEVGDDYVEFHGVVAELRGENGMGDVWCVSKGTGDGFSSLGALRGAYNRFLWTCWETDGNVSTAEPGDGGAAVTGSSSNIYLRPETNIN